jgi:pterin-4a-carbinolamine dehydratase
MISTGKKNPLGDEIMQVEESDINFWDKNWDNLTFEQKITFCSFMQAPFFATEGEFKNDHIIKDRYEYFQLKNMIEL